VSEKINKFLCGTESAIGDFAELIVGEAKHCWCCSFFRGLLYGGLVGSAVSALICW
jgi:hypothetical protein